MLPTQAYKLVELAPLDAFYSDRDMLVGREFEIVPSSGTAYPTDESCPPPYQFLSSAKFRNTDTGEVVTKGEIINNK